MADSETTVEERRKALAKLKRPDLDSEASSVGIDNPEDIKNAEEVVQAILDKEADDAAKAEAQAQHEERERNPRFSREDLLENPRIAGARRHIVFAALAANPDRSEFTKKQAEDLVAQFLKAKDSTREEDAA